MHLLGRDGYQALTIEAVAAEAGVAKTTIYRRYPSKHELVVAALLAETAFPTPPPEMPVRDAIAFLVRQAAAILIGRRAVRILGTFLVEEEREPALLETFRARVVEPRRALLTGILRAGIERGEVRPDAPLQIMGELLLGSLLARYVVGGQVDDDWIEELSETIWDAVRAGR
jgi:AcrR family transcriptional regulator